MISNDIKQKSSSGALIKIFASICFVLLEISAVAAWKTPTVGYEPSIYSATPPILWASVIISIVCGISIIFSQIMNKGYQRNKRWLIGLFLIFLCFTLCLSVYIIRGYDVWDLNGDTATHIGYVDQIISNGHAPDGLFGSDLIYPVTHIYTAELALMLDQGINLLHKLVPLYIGLLFVGFVYIFARGFLPDKGQAILATMVSCMIAADYYIPFYMGFMPYLLADFLFPVALLVVFKYLWTKKVGWGILSFIVLIASMPFHPILTIALIATLAGIWAFEKVMTGAHRFGLLHIANIDTLRKNHVQPLIILGLSVWFVLWISSFAVWGLTINSLMNLVVYGGTTHASELASATSDAAIYGYDVLTYFIRNELTVLAVLVMAVICLPIIIRAALKDKKINYLLLMYAPIIAIGVLILAFYFMNLGFGPTRLIFYIFVISLLFVGYFLFKILETLGNSRRRFVPIIGLGLVLILMSSLYLNGVMTLYPSPYVLKPNSETTSQEIQGMGWLFNDRTINSSIASMTLAPYRFADALLTPQENDAQLLPRIYPSDYAAKKVNMTIPYHFGYLNGTSLAGAFKFDTYLVLTAQDKSLYKDILPGMAQYRFTTDDFNNMEKDIGLYKLYSSGEFDTWLTHHKAAPYQGNNG
jgi:hypothetical protein